MQMLQQIALWNLDELSDDKLLMGQSILAKETSNSTPPICGFHVNFPGCTLLSMFFSWHDPNPYTLFARKWLVEVP